MNTGDEFYTLCASCSTGTLNGHSAPKGAMMNGVQRQGRMTINSTSERMEYAFLKQVFMLVNDVQGNAPKGYIPHRKTMWIPKTRSKHSVKVS
jgi:hypothetical protein